MHEYDFIILPPWAIGILERHSVDLFINTRSMMEMKMPTIESYFYVINSSLKQDSIFYCVNRYIKTTVGCPVRLSEYPFDEYWNILFPKPFWRNPHIHELVLSRVGCPSNDTQNYLRSLPKTNPGRLQLLCHRIFTGFKRLHLLLRSGY